MQISFTSSSGSVRAVRPLSPLGKAITYAIFALVGAGMLIGSYFFVASTRTFLRSAQKTTGEVIDLIAEQSTSGTGSKRRTSTSYFPLIRFTAANGTPIEFRSKSGSSSPSYHKGQTVEILYNPSTPEDACLNTWFDLWGPAVILGAMGAIFFLLGALPLLFFGSVLLIAFRQSGRTATPPPPPPAR